MNVFASEVQKQFYMGGLQDNLRDSVPMLMVSEVETENTEFIVNRYGADVSAQSTKNSLYRRATGFSYNRDKKSIDEIATVTDVILYQELMREGFDIVADRQDKHTFALRTAVHRHSVDTGVAGAGSVLDNEVLAGSASAGTPITMTDANPDNVVATIVQILQEQNAYGSGNPFVMMTPKQAKFFNLFAMGAGFSTADQALQDGIFAKSGAGQVIRGAIGFGGLDVIVTNEMPRTSLLTLTGALTAANTVTINGVVFTAAASPSTAGDVDVAASTEAQVDVLVAAINNAEYALASVASDSGNYVELSASNRAIFDSAGIRARKLSATTLEVTSFTSLTVAESGTATSFGAVVEHMLAGAVNAVTIAMPSEGMRADEKPLAAAVGGTGTHGFELTTFQMHDAVVWTYNAPKLVDVIVA
jgi:hypothetical protein